MKTINRARIFLFCFMMLFFASSFAEGFANDGILNGVTAAYGKLSGQWFNVIRGYAEHLFWLLVLVDVTWSALGWVKERNDFGEIMISLCNKAITIGFFYLLLKMADTWIPDIIESFTQIGKAASGAGAEDLSPDGVLLYGFKIALGIFQQLIALEVYEIMYMVMPLTLIALIVILAYAVIAGQFVVTVIESYVAIGAGVIMLGFGGSKFTADMSTSYLKYAVGTGLKLMLTYLVIGAGIGLFSDMNLLASSATGNPFDLIKAGLVLLCETFVFAILCWQIPAMTAAITSGSPSLSLGSALSTLTTLTGAQMAANLAQQTLQGGQSLASKADSYGLGIGMPGGGNSLRDLASSWNNEPEEYPGEIPSPATMGLRNSNSTEGKGNAFGSKVAPPEDSPEMKRILAEFVAASEKQKTSALDKIQPPSDSAQIQVQGFNMTHGKD